MTLRMSRRGFIFSSLLGISGLASTNTVIGGNARPRNSILIDNFEDGDLSEYQINEVNDAGISSTNVYQGFNSGYIQNKTASDSTIVSMPNKENSDQDDELNYYPSRGDTIVAYVKNPRQGEGNPGIYFGMQDPVGYQLNGEGYLLRVRSATNEVMLNDSASWNEPLATIDVEIPTDWIKLVVHWRENELEINALGKSVTVESSKFDDGGFGWFTGDYNSGKITPTISYLDYAYAIPNDPSREIDIDVKPGDDYTPININRERGYIPVAVIGTENFNPKNEIDVKNIRFGSPDVVKEGGGATPRNYGDIDELHGDGYLDLVFHFPIQETHFDEGDTKARLEAKTEDGGTVFGTDEINIIGSGNNSTDKEEKTGGKEDEDVDRSSTDKKDAKHRNKEPKHKNPNDNKEDPGKGGKRKDKHNKENNNINAGDDSSYSNPGKGNNKNNRKSNEGAKESHENRQEQNESLLKPIQFIRQIIGI